MNNTFKVWLVPIKMINILQFDRWDFNKLGSYRISYNLLFLAMDSINLMTHSSPQNSPVALNCNQNKYINLSSVVQGTICSNWYLHPWSLLFSPPLNHYISFPFVTGELRGWNFSVASQSGVLGIRISRCPRGWDVK